MLTILMGSDATLNEKHITTKANKQENLRISDLSNEYINAQ
jgi:hypothetical protein